MVTIGSTKFLEIPDILFPQGVQSPEVVVGLPLLLPLIGDGKFVAKFWHCFQIGMPLQ